MKKTYKLSDQILLVIASFSTVFIIFSIFVLHKSYLQIIILGGVLYALAFLMTYFLSWRFSKRILDLTMSVEEIAAGNFKKKLKSKYKDEIGQLTVALNELLSRLQSGVAQDVSRHQELNKAKTDFVTLASHQLRTPLSIIKWYVDFLINEDAGEISDEQKKYLKEVYKSNERLIELVNALLDVSRIDVGTFSIDPEPTDIIEKAEEALKKFADEIKKKKIKIIKKYDNLPEFNLDPRLTKMVFENILSNAIKYTPEKGVIKIEIKKTDADIFIKISDSGCGIPKEYQPKIFTKLFRAENARKIEAVGTGLGLYIVKAIIEKSGGKIWFESPSLEILLNDPKVKQGDIDKNSQGTTFFITIPLKGMKKKSGTKKLTSTEK